MASKIDVLSNALRKLGHASVSALDEDEPTIMASDAYEVIYPSLLVRHRWRFASKKAQLAKLTSSPINEWANAFQIPTDCLQTIGTYPRAAYEIYGDKIYTNQGSLELDYIYAVNIGDVPAYFQRALEYAVAADVAEGMTSNTSLVQAMNDRAEHELMIAMGVDSQARPNVAIRSNPFLEAHR